jgi:hypothetical protein
MATKIWQPHGSRSWLCILVRGFLAGHKPAYDRSSLVFNLNNEFATNAKLTYSPALIKTTAKAVGKRVAIAWPGSPI